MTLTFAFDPVIAQWGPFQLGWHGMFTALAVMVALWLAGRLAMQRHSERGGVRDRWLGHRLWGDRGAAVPRGRPPVVLPGQPAPDPGNLGGRHRGVRRVHRRPRRRRYRRLAVASRPLAAAGHRGAVHAGWPGDRP